MATIETAATPTPTPTTAVQYRGVAMLPNGKWRAYIVNRDGQSFNVSEFGTATAAALARDLAILAVLGPRTSATVLNFRVSFSDTELRFLCGRHTPARPSGVVAMVRLSDDGSYDIELSRFASRAFDAYMDPELVLNVANFHLAHSDMLHQLKKKAVITAGTTTNQETCAKAKLDAKREAFVQAAKNKATDELRVERYHRRRQQTGRTFEDENRWPVTMPAVDVNIDWFPGEELIYLPHGSCYVDEIILRKDLIKRVQTFSSNQTPSYTFRSNPHITLH